MDKKNKHIIKEANEGRLHHEKVMVGGGRDFTSRVKGTYCLNIMRQ
jgi:hypothetical protein